MRILASFLWLLMPLALLSISNGCRHLQPKSEIDHLISLINSKERKQNTLAVARTQEKGPENKSPQGEESDQDLSELPQPFRLADVEPLTGSGVLDTLSANEQPSPEFEPANVAQRRSTPPPSKPTGRPALIATIPKSVPRAGTKPRRLDPSNPLRPMDRKIKNRSLESLVNEWADKAKPVTKPGRIPAALSHFEGSTSLVLNCVDPNCDKCVEALPKTSGSRTLTRNQGQGSNQTEQTSTLDCDCGPESCRDCDSDSQIRLVTHTDHSKLTQVPLDVLSDWADADDTDIDDAGSLDRSRRTLSGAPKRMTRGQRADWNQRLEQTIAVLSDELESEQTGPNCNVAKLRMLRMLSGNISRASEPVSKFSTREQQGWLAQMAAVDNMITLAEKDWSKADEQQRRKLIHRCLLQLQQATVYLADSAPLQIQHTELCTSIRGFGQYTSAPLDHMQSTNEILVYCELENLSSQSVNENEMKMHETLLAGEVTIVDESGKEISRFKFPKIRDISRRHRRDYFVVFPFRIPNLKSGTYRVVTSLKDLHQTHRVAQAECQLQIQ